MKSTRQIKTTLDTQKGEREGDIFYRSKSRPVVPVLLAEKITAEATATPLQPRKPTLATV